MHQRVALGCTGSRMPDDLYKTIEPALRLASMFFGYSRYFYMMILRAREIHVPGINVLVRDGLLTNRTVLQCLDATWVPSREDEDAYDAAICEIVEYFRLYCAEDYRTIIANNLVYAATKNAMAPFWIYNLFNRECFDESTSSRFRHGSVQQRHRLLFHFAITLLHELAHVLRKRRQNDLVRHVRMGSLMDPEPLFEPHDVTAELGHAWETWAFGGTMYPTGFPVDVRSFGLRPWLWALNSHNVSCLDYPHGEFIIHASTMSSFFSTSGWEKHKKGTQPLVIELTPLRSLSGNVEDKENDSYDSSFLWRLESVHRGKSSAFVRYYPPVNSPLLQLPMSVDIEMMTTDFRKKTRRKLKRRAGRFGKWKAKRMNI